MTLAIVALAALIAVFLGGFGYLKWKASQRVALDPQTFCPVTGPRSATAVLLDLTDAVSPPTLQDLRNRFEALASDIPEGGLVAFYGLTERPGELDLLFTACNPGNGSNVDPLTSNPKTARDRWRTGYRQPFDDFMKALGSQQTAARSPIMAGIQQVKLTLFDANDMKQIDKTLIVASDMIEHTDDYSQYRLGVNYSKYKDSAAQEMFATSMDGVDVIVFYISRLGAPGTGREHPDFWGAWFRDNRATTVNVIRLEGAN